jgi:transcriptional regulator with XRE-family HTH domain
MGTVFQRLREERERLGMNQEEFADAAGLNRTAQIRYEKGTRAPDTNYLVAIAKLGADINYIVTGTPMPALASDEAELLLRYRAATSESRAMLLRALGVTVVGSSSGSTTIADSEVGQSITGTTHQPNLTINVGGQKRGKKK